MPPFLNQVQMQLRSKHHIFFQTRRIQERRGWNGWFGTRQEQRLKGQILDAGIWFIHEDGDFAKTADGTKYSISQISARCALHSVLKIKSISINTKCKLKTVLWCILPHFIPQIASIFSILEADYHFLFSNSVLIITFFWDKLLLAYRFFPCSYW